MTTNIKQSDVQKIPKLRFPGFSGEWEEKMLGEVIQVVDGDRGSNYPKSTDFYNEGYCLFLNAKNVTKRGFVFEETSFITKEKDQQLRKGKLERNDIILTTRGSVGHIAFYNKEIAFDNIRINSGMVLLRGNQKITDSNFVSRFLVSKKNQNRIQRISFGSAQPQLTVKEIRNLKISFSTLSEQQKIADFLGIVDEWMINLRSQKEVLEAYKKGMMHKIFSQEIRFKDEDGGDFPEWEEKMLGDVCNIETGKKDVNEGNKNGKYPFFTCAKRHTYSDNYSFDCKAILIAGNGEVGHCQRYIGKFEAYQRIYVLSDFLINFDYLFTLLNSRFRDSVNSQKQMGAMPYIKLGMLKSFFVPYPSLPEQQKIADFLSSLDNLIEAKQEQITKTEKWKKGLMQSLFV